ncbi:MAG: ornithine carbamoyltransferase [Campylobacter sp.]|nr:ornithine carbamoyltransferase [Campylobacter sp.]
MKISFECECVVLQKTLLLFCKKYASTRKDCDFIVSDTKINSQKPVFLIGSHIKLPFNKQNLLNALEEFYSTTWTKQSTQSELDFEKRLEMLLSNFKRDLVNLIRSEN